MRIVHTSDWHIGKIVSNFSMLEDQRFILEEIIDFLIRQQAQLLLVAGDLYDRSIPPAEAVTLLDDVFYRITKEAGIPLLAISGNHDSPQRLSFASRLCESSGLYLEGVYQKEIRRITLADEYGPVHFYCLPYLEPALVRADFPEEKIHSYDDAYRVVLRHNLPRLNQEERNILLAHGFFSYLHEPEAVERSDSEISLGGADLVDASYFDSFDYVALGHLHRPQKVGKEHIRYSGSPLKYSVSESGCEKSITTIHLLEKGVLSIKQAPLHPVRDLQCLRGSFEELCSPDFYPGNRQDYLFALLSDDSLIPGAMDRLRSLYPNILGLELTGRRRENESAAQAASYVKSKSPDELFSEFYRSVKGEEIPDGRLGIAREVFHQLKKEDAHAAD